MIVARWIAWGGMALLVSSLLVAAGAPDLLMVSALFLLVFTAPVDAGLEQLARQVYADAMAAHADTPPEA